MFKNILHGKSHIVVFYSVMQIHLIIFEREIKHFYIYLKKTQYFSTTLSKVQSATDRIILAFLYLCLHMGFNIHLISF